MAESHYAMLPVPEALEIVLAQALMLETVRVPLAAALGRVLAEPVRAHDPLPPFAASIKDGYAVCAADGPGVYPVVGEATAGHIPSFAVTPGTVAYITTGAPVPQGADAVVMVEETELLPGRTGVAHVRIRKSVKPGADVRPIGYDVAVGEEVLPAGVRLGAAELGLLATVGQAIVPVVRQPRVAVLSTGDELAAPGEAAPGQIPESVSLGAAAIVEQWGGSVVRCARLPDKLPLLQDAARKAADEDLIVVTGGASVGDYDFARQMFSDLEIIIPKVAIRPGKPVWMGRSGSAVILGLPGNPTAAMVTARLLLAPLVAGLSGRSPCEALKWRSDVLAVSLPSNGERETFLLGRAAPKGVEVLTRQDSSGQKALAMTSLLVRRPPGAAPAEPGQTIDVLEF